MFIKKIEISGFKSFAKKTILDFCSEDNSKNGITSVIGPNGSGKSNVSDALRWVVGEKSIKNLRGSKKEDVIFAGSSSKSKLGCAQVSIFFDNSKKKFDIDYNEVVITRKIYRDGENSYLINNSKVKLFDITTLLSKAGIGNNNHTIINQGMTDRILLSSPLERMGFLEDAAGVKGFQIKRNQSLKRIKKTQINIEKTKSLLREIEPQLRILRVQSKKIEKSQLTRDELVLKRKQYLAVKLNQVERKANNNEKELERIAKQIKVSQNRIKELEVKLKESSNDEIANQNKIIEEIRKFKKETETRRYQLERVGFKKETEASCIKSKIKELDKEEVVFVDKKYIISKLEKIKSELSGGFEKKSVSIISRISALLEDIQAGKTTKKKNKKEIDDKKKILAKEFEGKKEETNRNFLEIEKCKKELESRDNEIQKINLSNQKKQEAQVDYKDKSRRESFELEKAERYFQHLDLDKNKLQSELEEVLLEVKENFSGNLEDLRKLRVDSNLDKLKMEIEKLNWKLEQVQEIDPAVVAQFKEMKEQSDFLENESTDLSLTLKNLKKVILEMDKKIKFKIDKAFHAINKEFKGYFKLIFSGGSAGLNKVEIKKRILQGAEDDSVDESEEDPEVDFGLEIEVNPPGKRISSLTMLSGGERTLTSMALLFALISYNPPPFAFLDEIEANLDEANANKFSKILKKLSHKTQFILATHSREVMRVSDVLYGVTMNEEGYSKVFSVKLGQIENDKSLTNDAK